MQSLSLVIRYDTRCYFNVRSKADISQLNLPHGVMSEYFLSGRGQGHVSNFYIVDSEDFATASRRYTGNMHNSTVVGFL